MYHVGISFPFQYHIWSTWQGW